MSRKYSEDKPTGREYVDTTIEFRNITLMHCLRLPKQWEYLTKPLLDYSIKIEALVLMANKVYINPEHQNREELIEAYKKRDELLQEALRYFDPFDMSFKRLIDYTDIIGNEKRRLKNVLISIIEAEKKVNHELTKIEIEVVSRQDEFVYRSLSGEKKYKLRMTPKQKDRWLSKEEDSITEIGKRISSDRDAIKRLKVF